MKEFERNFVVDCGRSALSICARRGVCPNGKVLNHHVTLGKLFSAWRHLDTPSTVVLVEQPGLHRSERPARPHLLERAQTRLGITCQICDTQHVHVFITACVGVGTCWIHQGLVLLCVSSAFCLHPVCPHATPLEMSSLVSIWRCQH